MYIYIYIYNIYIYIYIYIYTAKLSLICTLTDWHMWHLRGIFVVGTCMATA